MVRAISFGSSGPFWPDRNLSAEPSPPTNIRRFVYRRCYTKSVRNENRVSTPQKGCFEIPKRLILVPFWPQNDFFKNDPKTLQNHFGGHLSTETPPYWTGRGTRIFSAWHLPVSACYFVCFSGGSIWESLTLFLLFYTEMTKKISQVIVNLVPMLYHWILLIWIEVYQEEENWIMTLSFCVDDIT